MVTAFPPTPQISRLMLNGLVAEGWEYLPTNIPGTYRPYWDMFHAIREFVQNALDEAGTFDISLTPEGLQISDSGKGVRMVDFLMHYREKPEWARGQFGEGLKIACLVCLRAGYPVEILTVNQIIRPVMVPITLERQEIPVLHFVFTEFPEKTQGTTVLIRGYKGDLYLDKFVQKLSEDNIVWTRVGKIQEHEYIELVLDYPKNAGRKWLYVRDIYVREFEEPSIFSYNFWHVQLDPDRVGLKYPAEVPQSVARIWGTEYVPKSAIKTLLETARDQGERYLETSDRVRIWPEWDIKTVWKETFYGIFGENAVLWTSHEMAQEATHAGKTIVKLTSNLTATLNSCRVKSDKDIWEELQKAKRVPVDPNVLESMEHFHLALCWWLERELRLMYVERTTLYPIKNIVAYSDLPRRGEYSGGGDNAEIHLRRDALKTEAQVVEVFLHEYAHHGSGGADDYTPEYEDARDYLGALIWRMDRRPTGWELYDLLKSKGVEPKFKPRGIRKPPRIPAEIAVGMKVRVKEGSFAGTVGRVMEIRHEATIEPTTRKEYITPKTLARIARDPNAEHDIWIEKEKLEPIAEGVFQDFYIGDIVRVKRYSDTPTRTRPYEMYEGKIIRLKMDNSQPWIIVQVFYPTRDAPGVEAQYAPDDLVMVTAGKPEEALGELFRAPEHSCPTCPKSAPLFSRKCRFASLCPNYRESSVTCQDEFDASHYCGKYKEYIVRSYAKSEAVINKARRNIDRLREKFKA